MARVTLKDVAKMAGVSPATASFSLNNVKGRVAPEVRQRVLECAELLHYTPNANARKLRTQCSNTYLLVYSESLLLERNASTMLFVAGMISHAAKLGKDVLIRLIDETKDWESNLQPFLQLWDSRAVDGIVFQFSDKLHMQPAFYDGLAAGHVNFVNIAYQPSPYPSVYIDDFQIMHDSISYIRSKGYDEIYFLCMKMDVMSSREKGYLDCIRALGIAGHPLYYQDEFRTKQELADLVLPLIRKDGPRVAIACWNDVDAINLLEVMQSLGYRVPQDVGIMGYDDIPSAEHTYPPLTTVLQPFDVMAQCAVDLLVKRQKSGGEDSAAASQIKISARIIERASI